METIKNYLETMFANMPNTPEVRRAKDELLSMMEDKYNELIAEGVSENAAVGTVISEFGNLDELAETLGLEKEVEQTKTREQNINRRFVTFDEVKRFLSYRVKCAWMRAIGVLLCITSVIYPIFFANFQQAHSYGLAGMFISIGIAVGLFVFSSVSGSEWGFLARTNCAIDISTAEYVRNERRRFAAVNALCKTVGVVMVVISWLPNAIAYGGVFTTVLMFAMIGIGVMLLVFSALINSSYDIILKLNDAETIGGTYGNENNAHYINRTAAGIMEVYWPTIVCIYLSVSFLTGAWHITWIIWPIAAVMGHILKIALTREEY